MNPKDLLAGSSYDQALYRKLAEPLPDRNAINRNIYSFYKEVEKLREKYGILDVHIVVKGNAIYPADRKDTSSDHFSRDTVPGVEGEYITNFHIGKPSEASVMAAYAYGAERKDHIKKMNIVAAGNGMREAD